MASSDVREKSGIASSGYWGCDVCVMTTYHEPNDDRVFQKEIKSLKRGGWHVVLIAPSDRPEFDQEGVRVIGIHRRKALGRVINAIKIAIDIASRGIDNIAEAIVELSRRGYHVRALLIGHIPSMDKEWLKGYVRETRIQDKLLPIGRVSYDDLPGYLHICNIAVDALQPVTSNIISSVLNKLFDYMAAGLPVVAPAFPMKMRCFYFLDLRPSFHNL